MTCVEPPSVWAAREDARVRECWKLLNAPIRFENPWDFVIVEEVQKGGEPILIMSLVSQLRKRHRHRNKRDKEATKRTILLRIGALIQQKELQRFRRKFVMMPK